jgi:type I restriction enzyme, S subunit
VHYVTGKFWTIDTAYFLSDFSGVTPKWLFYFFQTLDLRQMNEATGVPSLSRDLLYKIAVRTPSEPEQTKIAEVLSTVDQAIEQTEALIAKQQRIKTGLMQDLFCRGLLENGHMRPSREIAPDLYQKTELGWIPLNWRVSSCTSICERIIDCKNRTPPQSDDGHPVVRTSNIRNGAFQDADLLYTDPSSYLVWTARGKPVPGDIVITREAPVGEVCLIPERHPSVCLGQRVMLYRPSHQIVSSRFFLYALQSQQVQDYLELRSGGSTVGHVKVGDIRDLPMPLASTLLEQERIVSAIDGVVQKLELEQQKQVKLLQLKSSLMQDLLTGRKRVTPLLDAELVAS